MLTHTHYYNPPKIMDQTSECLLDKFATMDDENASKNEEPPQLLDSPYVDDDELQVKLTKFHEGSIMLTVNIQSLTSKFDQLKIYLKILLEKGISPAIICLQETWLSETADTKPFNLDGYHLIPKGYSTSSHGGIITYIKKKFNYKILPVKKNNKNIWEQHFIEINQKGIKTKLIIGNVYRPPRELKKLVNIFSEEFNTALEDLSKTKGEIVIAGDFNHDLLKVDTKPHSADFLDTVVTNSYMPRIVRPTRITKDSETLIDNFLFRFSPLFCTSQAFILTHKLSDHQTCLIKIDLFDDKLTRKQKFDKRKITIRQGGKNSLGKLIDELTETCVTDKLDKNEDADADKNFTLMSDIVTKAYNKHFPLVKVKFDKYKHKGSDWITDGIIQSIKQRNKLYKNLKNTSKDDDRYGNLETQLKNYNKILKRSIVLAKKKYYSNLFDKYQNDIRKTWKTINRLLNRDKTDNDQSTTMKINGQVTSDKKVIADEFNSFFTNIGLKIANDLPPTIKTPDDYLSNPPNSTFTFRQIDSDTIDRIISQELSNKSSRGFDGLSTKLVKQLKDVLIEPMTLITNQCLRQGIFPDLMKMARVVPLFKKGDRESIGNYRPVSILPALSKILEKVMSEQIIEYFENEKILSDSQYGFRKNRSTDYAAIELIDIISQTLDNKKKSLGIFMDLSKAFDTLNHEILLKKLVFYGFTENSIKLLKSYLTNRKQYVAWQEVESENLTINTGIPQGSILGPLLFIIYINDLSKACESFHPICFADDTNLICELDIFGRSSSIISNNVNNELAKISEWLLANKLSLNAEKTKYMIFREINTRNQNLVLQINDTILERVSTFKFLGLTLHENRSWTGHISEVNLKISRTVGIMNRLKKFIPSSILQTIYNSLMSPYLNKHLLLWGKSPLGNTNVLQRKSTRIILKEHYLAHTDPLFEKLRILKIEDMYNYQSMKLFYRCKKGLVPNFMIPFLEERIDATPYLTEHPLRNAHDHSIPLFRKTHSQQTIRFLIGKIVDAVPDELKEQFSRVSSTTFSQKIKNHYLGKYGAVCKIPNCYPCQASSKFRSSSK